MSLFKSIRDSFVQLHALLTELRPEEYVYPSPYLSHATIGQHTRHIIEMYQCLLAGYETGEVCYDNRKRNPQIETNQNTAAELLEVMLAAAEKPDKELVLKATYGDAGAAPLQLATNYYRELAYNLEHTIHHMALIKVGLKELNKEAVGDTFGVASSTTRHRHQ